MSLGENIALYRRRARLTQEELAYKLNVSRQTIYKWENNISRPTLNNLELLTKILAIDYNILLGGK